MEEIRFPCSGCGVTLRIANPDLIGKKLKCPRCEAITVIPAPADAAQDIPEVFPEPDEQPTTPATAGHRPPPGKAISATPIRRSAVSASAHQPASEEDEPVARRIARRQATKRRKGPDWTGIAAGVVAVVFLGTVAAAYCGYLGYQPEKLTFIPLERGAGAQAQPLRPRPEPNPVIPVLALPARDEAEEARLTAERQTNRLKAAATEQQCIAALRKSAAGQGFSPESAPLWQDNAKASQLAFSPDSQYLAWIASDGVVKVLDLKKAALKHELPGHGGTGWVAFSPDGATIAAAGSNHKVQLWDVDTGNFLRELVGRPGRETQGVAFSPDGRSVYAGGEELDKWDIGAAAPRPQLIALAGIDATAFAVHPRGNIVAARDSRATVQLWDVQSANSYDFAFPAPTLHSLIFSPDGWRLAALDSSGDKTTLHLCNLAEKSKRPLPANVERIASVAFTPDDSQLVIAGTSPGSRGVLQLWDLTSNQMRARAEGRSLGSITFLTVSPGGSLLATADARTGVRIWSLADLFANNSQADLLSDLRKRAQIDCVGKTVQVELKPGATAETIAKLAQVKGLTELSLGICDNLAERSLAGLKDLKELRRLDLSSSDPTEQVTDACLAGLKEIPDLQELRLRGCAALTDAGFAHLAGLKSLTKLDLSGTSITNAGLSRLKGLTGLTQLVLNDNNQVTTVGLAQLKTLVNLRELSLYGTGVTDAGLEVLKTFPRLTSLDLGATSVTDAGLANLAGLTELTELSLNSMKDVKGPGLQHFQGLSQLRHLQLIATPVQDEDLNALTMLAQLETLYLMQTPVTDAGLVHLHGLKKLKAIGLGLTKVTVVGIEALRRALPRAAISTFQGFAFGAPPDGIR